MDTFSDLLRGESGLDIVEYALIAGCLGLASIAVLTRVAAKNEAVLSNLGQVVTQVSGPAQSSPARR